MAELGVETFFAPIPELNSRLVAREISAEELVRAFATRLERLGPRYNALALPLPQQAIRRAKEVDKEIKLGRLRGPLQGIPYGAKDLLSFAGQITTWGAKPYAAQIFDYTATTLEKLDAVGAVLTGKLAMVELAGGGGYRLASASMFGPGLNPYDLPLVRRIFQRFRVSRRRRSRALRARLGNFRSIVAGVFLRRHRPAPHVRAGQPLRRHGALVDAR